MTQTPMPRQLAKPWQFMNVIPNGCFLNDLSGWIADANTTATRVLVDDAPAVQLKAKAAGDVEISTVTGARACWAEPGKEHVWTGLYRAAVTPRAWRLELTYLSTSGAVVHTSQFNIPAAAPAAEWKDQWVRNTAPASAAQLVYTATVVGCAANEVHYFDELGVFVGNAMDPDHPDDPGYYTYYDEATPGRWQVGFGRGSSGVISRWGAPEVTP